METNYPAGAIVECEFKRSAASATTMSLGGDRPRRRTSAPPNPRNERKVLGIRFFSGSLREAVKIGCDGGLVVAPAAPALASLLSHAPYREALHGADLVLTDSSVMVGLWNVLQRDTLPKISGLRYLRALLEEDRFRNSKRILWVMPSLQSMERNRQWQHSSGFAIASRDCYVAPDYHAGCEDYKLLRIVRERRPEHIVICVGGGVQEPLGWFLKQSCDFRPSIYCLGAAIGFLSGDQTAIPSVADRLGLGWLIRCISSPRRYVPRYFQALRLVGLICRFRAADPVAG